MSLPNVEVANVEDAIAAIGRGEMVVVVDDEDRENEGDLVMAAEFATPENIAFFLAHTSGLICVPLMPERIDELELPLMVPQNTESQRTAFTVTVDYKPATTTGISAGDRAATIRALIDPRHEPERLRPPRPHVPAPLPHRRRPQARRSHGGDDRPRPHGRLLPGGCPLRDRHRRQAVDGAAARAGGLRRGARSRR